MISKGECGAGDRGAAVRLGCVSYLNALPLIEGLEKAAGVTIRRAPPSELLAMLRAGEVGVALLSLIDSQRSPEAITLIPAGVIGCDGRTLTVRVYSRVPFERVTRVHADADSHTGAALARVALRRLHGASAEVVRFDARAARAGGAPWPETALMIGDKVVAGAPPHGEYAHELDLGEAWKRLTGMGFTYAAWACLTSEAGSERVRLARDLLDRQRRHNATRLDRVALDRAAEHGWPAGEAREYLGSLLRYDAGGPGSARRASIERFFDWCAEDGVTERRRPTAWLDESPAPGEAAGAWRG